MLHGVIVNSLSVIEPDGVAQLRATLNRHHVPLWTIATMFGGSNAYQGNRSHLNGDPRVPVILATSGLVPHLRKRQAG